MYRTKAVDGDAAMQPKKAPDAECPSSNDSTINGTKPAVHQLNRRSILFGAGALAAATALNAPAAAESTPAQEAPSSSPTMRSATRSRRVAAAGLPALPSLGVIALNRMGFGPRVGDLALFAGLGNTPEARLQAYVEQQLAPESIDDSECDTRLANYGFITLNKSLAQLWTDHYRHSETNYLPANETRKATWIKAVYSKRQLVQVLADFWHNHFNVFGWDYWIASSFVHYDRDVIRAHMLGNFREMLGAVARSPAMLYYLDNQSNSGGNPNENYAREAFELHTFGAENYLGVRDANDPLIFDENGERLGYIDSDVYGATTCFTGWRINTDTGQFEFDLQSHFPFQKIVLGEIIKENQGEKDGDIVLDLLASHPGTARYICRKLCRRLISDHPSEQTVQDAAAVFVAQQNAPDQLKQVVRTILLSDEFRTTWGAKMKRPFEYAVSSLRAAGANFVPENPFFWWYGSTGQELFRWHPPDGYPDMKEDWSSTMPLLQRWRLCNSLLGWTIGGEGLDKDEHRLRFLEHMPSSINVPNDIVNYWSNRLLGRALPPEERQPILEFMAGGRNPDFQIPADEIAARLRYMVGLILMSPSFQWR